MIVKPAYQACVVGAGPAGLASAILLAQAGVDTLLAARPAPEGHIDRRTSALMQASVQLLRHIGVWPQLEQNAAPLWVMRLIDNTNRMLRARDIDFDARELGPEPFGWNITNAALTRALADKARTLDHLDIFDTQGLDALGFTGRQVKLHFNDLGHDLVAQIVLGADGRQSRVRSEAGIKTRQWTYDQTALVCTFTHDQPHNGVSAEYHRRAGPLTLVPLSERTSSLVWIEKPDVAKNLLGLDETDFITGLNKAIHGALGTISDLTPRQIFPISGMTARKFAASRTMLIGEAAHVVPPIGAQGLNLGLRDAALASQMVAAAIEKNEDPGSAKVLDIYDRKRRRDILPRTIAIDVLNRSLMSDFLPFQGLRSAGMFALGKIGPLRRAVMAQGIAPSHDLPRAMLPGGHKIGENP